MQCKHPEVNDLNTLTEDQLRECGCERCKPVAERKELERLRAEERRRKAEEAARQEAARIAQEIANERAKAVAQVSTLVEEEVKRQLKAAGIDPNRDPFVQDAIYRRITFPNVITSDARLNHRERDYSPEMREFVKYIRFGAFAKALAEGTDASGGVLVPEEFRAEVVRKLASATVLRRAGARVLDTSRDQLIVPRVATSGAGAWVGENSSIPEGEPTFDQVAFTPHKYARLVRTSREMLQDPAVDVVDLLTDLFAEDFAAAEDAAFIDGTGTGQPKGIRQHAGIATVAVADGTNKKLAYADLLELESAVPRQYRSGAVFLASPKAVKILKQLTDGNGRPLWDPNLMQAGEPPRLLGYPVYESDAIPANLGDGGDETELLFGNPRYYWIVQRQDMSIERSEHRYFELDQVAFRGTMRVDGQLVVEEAWAKLTGFNK